MRASEAAKVMAILRGAYPGASLTEETIAVYEKMLSDLSFDQAQAAVLEHVATSKWFPAISEIRAIVARRTLGAPTAAEAMAQLALPAGQRGDLHPLVRKALSIMGGDHERRTTEMPAAWRSQFRECYGELVAEAHLKTTTRVLGEFSSPKPKELPDGDRRGGPQALGDIIEIRSRVRD